MIDAAAADVAIDGESISRALRRIQNGVLERYTLIFAIGLADNPRPVHPGDRSPGLAMSYVLSLLILVPLLGSGVTFALSSLGGGRKGGARTWPRRSPARRSSSPDTRSGRSTRSTPALGSYALTEDHPWITLPGFGVDITAGRSTG